jgi:hypothetical protein
MEMKLLNALSEINNPFILETEGWETVNERKNQR